MLHNELAAKMKKIQLLRRIWIQKTQPDVELYFGQLPILEYIRKNPGCTQAEIAEHLCVTPASISTSTKRLQKSGLLTKTTEIVQVLTNLGCCYFHPCAQFVGGDSFNALFH